MYRNDAKLDGCMQEAVIDGDTFDFVIDLGYGNLTHERVRLRGIDTAETYGESKDSKEYKLGKKHERFVEGWMLQIIHDSNEEFPFTILSEEFRPYDSFGRVLGDIQSRKTEASLRSALLNEFDGVKYQG